MKLGMCVAVACLAACVPLRGQSPAEPTPAASATPTAMVVPAEPARILYPAANAQPTPLAVRTGSEAPAISGLAMTFLVLLALCAGAFYLLRRQTGFALIAKGQRKLLVSESRSLGNRQFLVVVEYEAERILLGVTPGKIDYLCPLPFKEPVT